MKTNVFLFVLGIVIAIVLVTGSYGFGFDIASCGMILTFYLYGILTIVSAQIARQTAKTKMDYYIILCVCDAGILLFLYLINFFVGVIFSEVFYVPVSSIIKCFLSFIIGFLPGFAYYIFIVYTKKYNTGFSCQEK